MAMLLGKKVGMTQVYDELGRLLPVTVIEAGPCAVLQVKTKQTDGYNAVQLGYDDVKASRQKKPAAGHSKKADTSVKKLVREWRFADDAQPEYKSGDSLTVSIFAGNNFVDVIGTSKGKGFAGVMKRHHFAGFPSSHGTERKHRTSGSLASFATDRGHSGKLKKGKRMGGHMGCERVTTSNHRLVSIDEKNNLLVVKGSVPGASGSYVIVRSSRKQ
jgi:large subunit ribosomal protein L3